MLSRPSRFHGQKDLRAVYRNGRSFRRGQLMLKILPATHRKSYRASVVVSKKVSASAVKRNRIRRQIYEAVRLLMPQDAPYDLIITVFDESVATMPNDQLNKSIKELISSATKAS